jgi:hypothetical protein
MTMKTPGVHNPKYKPNTVRPVAATTVTVDSGTLTPEPGRSMEVRRQRTIHGSPRQTAQRRRLQRQFDPPLQRRPNKTGMPDEIKADMEKTFETNFSDVRVHAGSSKAGEVGAAAYARGDEVHFAPGRYQPSTAGGRQLLGHELAHVVQQREGRVAATGKVGGMPLNDDPALEREADEMGQRAKNRR